MTFLRTSLFSILVGALAFAGSAGAADFYKGKTVNVIINYSAGGNTDIQGRSVLRFMENYISGEPRFVVRNVAGAGGSVGANFLAEAGKTDGTMMGIFTIPIMAQIMKAPELRVDLRTFQMVGAIAQQTISHIRKEAAGGIEKIEDLFEIDTPIVTAGHGPTSSKDLRIRLFMEALDIPFRHVTGYKSAGRIRAAILKGEVDMTADSLTGYYARVVPQLMKPGVSMPLWHIGLPTDDGEDMKCSPLLEDRMPCFIQVYEMRHGKGARPSGVRWDAMRVIAGTRQLLRIIVLPEGAPKEALEVLRAAWKKTMEDPGYLAEYEKQNASELVGWEGAVAQEKLQQAATIDPDVQQWLLDYAEKGKQ